MQNQNQAQNQDQDQKNPEQSQKLQKLKKSENSEKSEKQSKNTESCHKGHRKRMRKRFYETGIDGFHEHEILEMLLYQCYARKNTNEIAHALLRDFLTLPGVLEASPERLKLVDHVNETTAFNLNFLGEVFQYWQRYTEGQIRMETSEKRKIFFFRQLSGEHEKELFMIACLDHCMRLKQFSTIGSGDYEKVRIDIKKLAKYVLSSDYSNIVIAHNHPMGSARPSQDDIIATTGIRNLMRTLGLNLIDHVIVGEGEVYSMAEHHRI